MAKDRSGRRISTNCRVSSALEGVFSKRSDPRSAENWKAAVEEAKEFKLKDFVRTPDGKVGRVAEISPRGTIFVKFTTGVPVSYLATMLTKN